MYKDIQTKLRQEILDTSEDISYEELMGLPYLDAFVREIMRVDAPVPEIYREVMEDDILPTSVPSYDSCGKVVDAIPVKKGQVLVLPLLEINRSKALWGPTAREFRPERWLDGNLPPGAEAIHSFNHLVTFADGYVSVVGLTWLFSSVSSDLGRALARTTVSKFYFHVISQLTSRYKAIAEFKVHKLF